MASVKNLKSQGKAWSRVSSDDPTYTLRKQQFADAPPAKMMRPVRYLRKLAAQALGEWHQSIKTISGAPALDFPQRQVDAYFGARSENGGSRVQRIVAAR